MDALAKIKSEMLPFAELMGIEFTHAAPDRVVAEMTVRDDLCTRPAVLHGGAIMAFADTLGGVGTFLNLPEGAGTTTIESKTTSSPPHRSVRASQLRQPRCIAAGVPWCGRPASRQPKAASSRS